MESRISFYTSWFGFFSRPMKRDQLNNVKFRLIDLFQVGEMDDLIVLLLSNR